MTEIESEDTLIITQNKKEKDTSIAIKDLEALTEQVASSIPKESPLPWKCTIFRVPLVLRRHDENAYVPYIVSIGAIHHGKESLKDMESNKRWYLGALLSRLQQSQVSLESLIKSTTELEESARAYEGLRNREDPIFNTSWMIPTLGHDLMLLENQLPWLVLDHLFQLTKVSDGQLEQPSLAELAVRFFGFMMPMTVEAKPNHPESNKHLLDLLRNRLVATSTQPSFPAPDTKLELIPCATSLLDAGVKFKMSTADNILELKFNDGVMEIPPLRIHEITGSVFRNIIAYEQCDSQCTDRVTSYAVLLSRLINSSKDVDLLCRAKILDNWLNPEDVSLLFYRLYNDAGV
ncbi:hypothetical protein HHK36_015791 [Tetracentron sinense]|uniref:Uncharacterized protein n=1 Tax=Tetracentron sinense TaxID=13715 RepID=A0A834Z9X1_TETSI|nr:hypothetical protein HHK36_015791 [Tetracentron sinense]